MRKMDKFLKRILGVLVGMVVCNVCGYAQLLQNDLEHLMLDFHKDFENMLDNWSADYISPLPSIQTPEQNANQVTNDQVPQTGNPIICPFGNSSNDNGEFVSCLFPAVNNQNVNGTLIVENAQVDVNEASGTSGLLPTIVDRVVPVDLQSIELNETIVTNFFDHIRWYIQDPLALPDKSKLKKFQSLITLYGKTKEVQVYGLSKFEIIDTIVNTTGARILNKFKWPYLNVTGNYELDVSGPRIHFYGDGLFSVNITDLIFGYDFSLGENENKTIRLDTLAVDLNIGNVSMKLDNFLDGTLTDTANSFLGEIVPQALSNALPELKERINTKAIKLVNRYLGNVYAYNMTDFIHRFIAE